MLDMFALCLFAVARHATSECIYKINAICSHFACLRLLGAQQRIFLYKMMTVSPYYSCSNMGKGVKMENNTKNKTTNNANKAQKATTKNTANVKNKTANTKNCGKGCDCKER